MSTTSKPAGRYTPVTNFSHIHGLAVDPTNPNVLYVGTHLGLVRGVADSDWAWVGDLRADFMGFTMHPNGKVFYASGHKVPDAPMMGVARSSDGGFTWEIIALQGKVDFHALTLSRANPQILYGWYYRDRKLYKSTDGGRSWRHPSAQGLSDVIALATDGASEQTLWAATAHGLYRSTDGGETFVRVSFAGAAVITVAVDPSNPQVLYASLEAGLRQSTDGGQTWQAIGQDIHEIYHLAIDPTNAQVVYAAGDSAIYKSTDGGESWKLVKPAERGH
jgi:photosystem II stability/assembly factor-like uncharacterized protein